jgi:DNA-binding transcriptional ArsR family regulator
VNSPTPPTSENPADGEPAESPLPRQAIIDARAMRALAHPLRVALLDAIRRDGQITATRAAELLGESPGNMSWHLQTLAKYGFVEETGEGRGRSRPWRATSPGHVMQTGTGDPERDTAGDALARTLLDRTFAQVQEWWSLRHTYPPEWERAAFMSDAVTYLTAPEMAAVMDEITAIYDRHRDRKDKDRRPPDALPVHLYSHGHPLPATPSGN